MQEEGKVAYDKKILVFFEFKDTYYSLSKEQKEYEDTLPERLRKTYLKQEYQDLSVERDTEVIFVDLNDTKKFQHIYKDGDKSTFYEIKPKDCIRDALKEIEKIAKKYMDDNKDPNINIKLQFAFGGHGSLNSSIITDAKRGVTGKGADGLLDVKDLANPISELIRSLESDKNSALYWKDTKFVRPIINITSKELIGLSCFAANIPEPIIYEEKKGRSEQIKATLRRWLLPKPQTKKLKPRDKYKETHDIKELEGANNALAALNNEFKKHWRNYKFDKVKGMRYENYTNPYFKQREDGKSFLAIKNAKEKSEHFLNPSIADPKKSRIIKFVPKQEPTFLERKLAPTLVEAKPPKPPEAEKKYDKKILVLFDFEEMYYPLTKEQQEYQNTLPEEDRITYRKKLYQYSLPKGTDTEVIFVNLNDTKNFDRKFLKPTEYHISPKEYCISDVHQKIQEIVKQYSKQNSTVDVNIKLQFAFGGHGSANSSTITDGKREFTGKGASGIFYVGNLREPIKDIIHNIRAISNTNKNSNSTALPRANITSTELIGASSYSAYTPVYEEKKGWLEKIKAFLRRCLLRKPKPEETQKPKDQYKETHDIKELESANNALGVLARALGRERFCPIDKVKGMRGENGTTLEDVGVGESGSFYEVDAKDKHLLNSNSNAPDSRIIKFVPKPKPTFWERKLAPTLVEVKLPKLGKPLPEPNHQNNKFRKKELERPRRGSEASVHSNSSMGSRRDSNSSAFSVNI
jgi:hypothetical protein